MFVCGGEGRGEASNCWEVVSMRSFLSRGRKLLRRSVGQTRNRPTTDNPPGSSTDT